MVTPRVCSLTKRNGNIYLDVDKLEVLDGVCSLTKRNGNYSFDSIISNCKQVCSLTKRNGNPPSGKVYSR